MWFAGIVVLTIYCKSTTKYSNSNNNDNINTQLE